jgi:hypothetical protein
VTTAKWHKCTGCELSSQRVKILLTACRNALGGASQSVSAIAKGLLGTTIVAMRGLPEFNILLVRLAREKTF